MPDTIRLKNRYIRQLAGHPFTLASLVTELIGRPDFEHRPIKKEGKNLQMLDGDGQELELHVVNQALGWYEPGNVERYDRAEKKLVPFPAFYEWDADGKGAYVVPKVDPKTKQIKRRKDGKVLVQAKFRWFHILEITTLEPVSVKLPRPKKDEQGKEILDAQGNLIWEDHEFAGTSFKVEVSDGGEASQYGKIMALIKGKTDGVRAAAERLRKLGQAQAADLLEKTSDPLAVVLTIGYHPEAAEKSDIYTITAADDPVTHAEERPSGQRAEPMRAEDPVIPF